MWGRGKEIKKQLVQMSSVLPLILNTRLKSDPLGIINTKRKMISSVGGETKESGSPTVLSVFFSLNWITGLQIFIILFSMFFCISEVFYNKIISEVGENQLLPGHLMQR